MGAELSKPLGFMSSDEIMAQQNVIEKNMPILGLTKTQSTETQPEEIMSPEDIEHRRIRLVELAGGEKMLPETLEQGRADERKGNDTSFAALISREWDKLPQTEIPIESSVAEKGYVALVGAIAS